MKYKIINEIDPFINESKMVDFYEEITGEKRKPFFGVTEASFINNNKIIIGPGPVTAHQSNEYITVKSLYKTCEIYKKIINKICNENTVE
jgi:acetylornithine deacetylase/succinyl-diaminopimelate desuccinylase-like protein